MKRVLFLAIFLLSTLNNAYGEETPSVQQKSQFRLQDFNPWLSYGSWGVFLMGTGLYFAPETESPRFPNDQVNAYG